MESRRNDRAERASHPRVLVVFDFDKTLAPDTTGALLESLGVSGDDFLRDHMGPLLEAGWDLPFAQARGLVDLSRSEAGPITRDGLAAVGRSMELYPGVEAIFEHLEARVRAIDASLDLECHLLTAGYVDVPAATPVADRFTSIIGGEWAFDEDGAIDWPKRMVGHFDKVRHLKALAKGLDSVEPTRQVDVDAALDEAEWHAPWEQIVFVGDGDSDLPAFDFLRSVSGTAIGVRQAGEDRNWDAREHMRAGQEVATLVESDFTPDTPLHRALTAAVSRAAHWASLVATG